MGVISSAIHGVLEQFTSTTYNHMHLSMHGEESSMNLCSFSCLYCSYLDHYAQHNDLHVSTFTRLRHIRDIAELRIVTICPGCGDVLVSATVWCYDPHIQLQHARLLHPSPGAPPAAQEEHQDQGQLHLR